MFARPSPPSARGFAARPLDWPGGEGLAARLGAPWIPLYHTSVCSRSSCVELGENTSFVMQLQYPVHKICCIVDCANIYCWYTCSSIQQVCVVFNICTSLVPRPSREDLGTRLYLHLCCCQYSAIHGYWITVWIT